MTIVEALKKLVSAYGGTSNAKTIVPALKDCATALGGESTAVTASQAIADVADAVEAGGGGGGGGGDFSTLTKLSYTVEDNILTFQYTWGELYAMWADDAFRPYFVYDGKTYIFLSVTDDSFEGTEMYSADIWDIRSAYIDTGGVANDPVTVEMGDSPK